MADDVEYTIKNDDEEIVVKEHNYKLPFINYHSKTTFNKKTKERTKSRDVDYDFSTDNVVKSAVVLTITAGSFNVVCNGLSKLINASKRKK